MKTMKTTVVTLTAALLVAGAPLFAQPGAGPSPRPEGRGEEAERHRGEERRRIVEHERQVIRGPAHEGERRMGPPPGGRGPAAHRPPGHDPLAGHFFPPDLIMHHQHALNLGEDQRKRMVEAIQKMQAQMTELQWQLEAEQAALGAMARAERAEEKPFAAQVDKVVRLEGEMKRTQLQLLLRLKNELKPEQQEKLRDLMRRSGPPPLRPREAGR